MPFERYYTAAQLEEMEAARLAEEAKKANAGDDAPQRALQVKYYSQIVTPILPNFILHKQ